jgi:hypothetical protein
MGIGAPAWTPVLLQRHVHDTFDIGYSRPNCRHLPKEAGLMYQNLRRATAESGAEEHEESVEEFKHGG